MNNGVRGAMDHLVRREAETWRQFVARSRWPWGTPLLALALVWTHTQYYASYAVPGEPCTASGAVDTFGHAFRSIFTHADGEHLASNVIALVEHGVLLEVMHGAARLTAIFVASGVFGVLFWHNALPEDAVVSYRGASAAVYGVIAALAAHITVNWRETPLRWVWLLALALTLAQNVYVWSLDDETNVAHEAHLGGALTGASLGLGLLRNYAVAGWERTVAALGALAFAALFVLVVARLLC